jgi:hypothetical protein
LSGPHWSVILDFEPLRPGEEECAAALRLLRRLRQQHGPRFFDLVVVDSWYANGPFLKAVVEELGWPVIAVLKQERYEIHQEARALSRGQKPDRVVARDGRQVEIWDLSALRFSDTYPGPVRVVKVRERWRERRRVGGQWVRQDKEQNWIWVVAGALGGYDGAAIRDLGHLRYRWRLRPGLEYNRWRGLHVQHGRRVFRERDYRPTRCRRADDRRHLLAHRRLLGALCRANARCAAVVHLPHDHQHRGRFLAIAFHRLGVATEHQQRQFAELE